jgi:hypothetical protein
MKNILPKSFILLSIAVLFFTSCHNSGCTNKNAVNFDITADEDDGSCVVCRTTTDDIAYKLTYLQDNSCCSEYSGQLVAIAYVHQFREIPNDKLCGSPKSNLNIRFKNLKEKTMQIQNFSVSEMSGPVDVFISASLNVTIGPGEIVDIGDFPNAIVNNPAGIPITLDSLRIVSSNIIYY